MGFQFYYCSFNKMIGSYSQTSDLQSQNHIDLVSQILNHDHFRLMLRQTVSDMCKRNMETEQYDYKPFGEMVSEVVDLLYVYMNDSIMKYSSEYSERMYRKFEQLYLEHQMKMRRKMQERFTDILEQLTERIDNINLPLGLASLHAHHRAIKREVSEKRKSLTSKIINSSVSVNSSQDNSNRADDDSLSGFQGLLDSEFSLQATKKIQEMSARITETQALVKEGKGEFSKKLNKVNQTIKKLEYQLVSIKKNIQENLQVNLEGVWNIVSELEKKIQDVGSGSIQSN